MDFTERPPYVQFEMRPEEDRSASIKAGHYVAKNVAYALITSPGSRDCTEQIADEWLARIKERARSGTFNPKWVEHFEFLYKEWTNENTLPENGAPIKGWPIASPAMQQQILQANVRTVEDLAAANEDTMRRIGMGARDLQTKARAWLEAASGTGKVAAKNAALEVENEQLKERLKVLEQRLASVEQAPRRGRPPKARNEDALIEE